MDDKIQYSLLHSNYTEYNPIKILWYIISVVVISELKDKVWGFLHSIQRLRSYWDASLALSFIGVKLVISEIHKKELFLYLKATRKV